MAFVVVKRAVHGKAFRERQCTAGQVGGRIQALMHSEARSRVAAQVSIAQTLDQCSPRSAFRHALPASLSIMHAHRPCCGAWVATCMHALTCLQLGQRGLTCSESFRHLQWKMWPQRSAAHCVSSSPSRQMAQRTMPRMADRLQLGGQAMSLWVFHMVPSRRAAGLAWLMGSCWAVRSCRPQISGPTLQIIAKWFENLALQRALGLKPAGMLLCWANEDG